MSDRLRDAVWEGNLLEVRRLIEDEGEDPHKRDRWGRTALELSCTQCDLNLVKCLIEEQNCDPNSVDEHDCIPLHYSCGRWDYLPGCIDLRMDVVKYLIETCHCDPMCADESGRTPLHYAAGKKYCDVVKYLIETCHCDPTCKDKNGRTPLHGASTRRKEYLDMVKYLIETCHCDPMCADNDGQTPFHLAARKKCWDVVKYLIETCHCDPMCVDKDGWTPFHLAVSQGKWDIVKYLIETCHCDPMCVDKDGWTPFHLAVSQGKWDIVKYLIETCHCDPMCVDMNGRTPFHWAVSQKRWDMMKYLIETCHCDPTCVDKNGWTPLHEAVSQGSWDMVKYLIETCHCDPMCVDKHGWTPFHEAVSQGSWDTVKYLIETCHCDPMCVDKGGRTPFHLAVSQGSWDTVKYLIETCHCDPMCVDKGGRTPFHLAVSQGSWDTVKYLIETCHCDPMCVDKDGWTPFHLAVSQGRWDTVKYLIETCHCDPMSVDREGWTVLQRAVQQGDLKAVTHLIETCHCDHMCMDKHGQTLLHLAIKEYRMLIAKYLIENCKYDPMCVDKKGWTPLHWTVRLKHRYMTEYLLVNCKCNPNCKDEDGCTPLDLDVNNHVSRSCARLLLEAGAKPTAKPPPPPVKIFIVGNPSAGKSSLTKALQTESSTLGAKLPFITGSRLVRNVEEKTAGIVPCQFTSRNYGEVTFFDFAGQQEYYASHAALLKHSISSATPVFLLVVDLRDSKEDIEQKLLFWSSFLANQCTSITSKPHVIIVGSHSDVVKSMGEDPKTKINLEFLHTLDLRLQISDFVPMDCRKFNSRKMSKLRTSLKNVCETVREQLHESANLHYLFVFLLDRFRGVSAVTCEEVQKLASSESLEIPLRQNNPDYLYRSCEELNKAGYIIFIKNCEDVTKSWIVLDQASLLSEVNGVLFAPEGFKQHYSLANSTGVVPFSRLAEKFSQHDPDMLVLFLSHFEFCCEIQDLEVLQLINQDHCPQGETTGLSTHERYFFFPGLVSLEVPDGVWSPDPQFPHHCGWILQCCDPGKYLTSQFLQALLLRIAFSCALAPDRDAPGSSMLQRKCMFWKNGIYWRNRKGVKALVEIRNPPQIREVVVMLCCLADRERECAHLRSTVIQIALRAKEQFCASVQTKQFFIHPSLLKEYPFECDRAEHGLVSVTEVEKAIAEGDQLVINNALEQIELKQLLIFSRLPQAEVSGKKIPIVFLPPVIISFFFCRCTCI